MRERLCVHAVALLNFPCVDMALQQECMHGGHGMHLSMHAVMPRTTWGMSIDRVHEMLNCISCVGDK